MGKYTIDEVKGITKRFIHDMVPRFEEEGIQTGYTYEDLEIFTPKELKDIYVIQKRLDNLSSDFFNYYYSRFTENDFKKMSTYNSIEEVTDYIILRYTEIDKNGYFDYQKPKKLKIGVKKIKETEVAIKNQEKDIRNKKKQILREQEYLNTTGRIMTGESDLIDNHGKWAVETGFDIKDGLNPKIRRALKASIIKEANKIKGKNITMNF
jgi:hypothetical protein